MAENSPLVRVDPSGHADCKAGENACWVNEWVWKDRCYRQHRVLDSLPSWDDPRNTVSFEARYSAALAYLHLLEDPLYFANLYLNPGKGGWGQDPETVSLEIFAQYTQLHMTGTELLMSTVASVYGAPATIQLYDAHQENMHQLASNLPIETGATVVGALVVPSFAKDAGGFVRWLKDIVEPQCRGGCVLSEGEADMLVNMADQYGVNYRLDAGHDGTAWDAPHINFGNKGQAHVSVPPDYALPGDR